MTLNEYLDLAGTIKDGYVVAALTDEYIIDRWPLSNSSFDDKEDRLLEIRIFNREKELKLIRADILSEFIFRDSSELVGLDYYEESQYLDINTKLGKNNQGQVTANGGGKYYLPVDYIDDTCIVIGYYISKYEKSGQARICDWRLVDFSKGK